jgi:hypothetical protein
VGEPPAPDGPWDAPADACVLVLGDSGPEDGDLAPWLPGTVRPAQTIGVLVGAGSAPALRRFCQAVVSVRAAVDAPGSRTGTPAAALPDDSGLAQVRELVDRRLVARGEVLKARTVLSALDSVLRGAPVRPGSRSLFYQLEEIRSGAHELVELELLDGLYSGEVRVPDDRRRAAERLLGVEGEPEWARLGCGPDAGPAELADAAAAELARWQRAAAHPTSTAASRHLADFLVRTCERLLSASAGPGERAVRGMPVHGGPPPPPPTGRADAGRRLNPTPPYDEGEMRDG